MWGSIIPAAWSFMLACRSRGLGTVWTTFHLYREREVAELLGIPYDDVMQAALIPVAYTLGTDFKPAARAPLETMVHWDEWALTLELRGSAASRSGSRGRCCRTGSRDLPPNVVAEDGSSLETVLPIGAGARVVRVVRGRRGSALVDVAEAAPVIRHMLRLDEDLSEFYARGRGGPGAGVGGRRRGADAAQPDGLRGPGQDDLHHQLHLVGDGPDGHRAGE